MNFLDPKSVHDGDRRLIFVGGTDTDVGKTHYTCLGIASEPEPERVGVYKPVASGMEVDRDGNVFWSDVRRLHRSLRGRVNEDRICNQRFKAALAPPAAAAAEGKLVDEQVVVDGFQWWCEQNLRCLWIEGAGGCFSPISKNWLCLDAYEAMLTKANIESRNIQVELHLVAANRLGVIHQVNSTLRAIDAHEFSKRIAQRVVVLNQVDARPDVSSKLNAEAIRRWNPSITVLELPHDGRGH